MKQEKLYWRTKEGELIRVSKLENGHLVNIMRMLYRNSERIRTALVVQHSRLAMTLSGEMAVELAEREIAGISDWSETEVLNEAFPCFRALCREVIKRDLIDEVPFESWELIEIKNPLASMMDR